MLKKIAVFGLTPGEYFLCEIYTLNEEKKIALPYSLFSPLPALKLINGELCDAEGEVFDFLEIDLEEAAMPIEV